MLAGFTSIRAIHAEVVCGLPVCDIKAKVEELKKSTQNTRYQTFLNFTQQYKKSKDVAAFDNLVEFSLAAKPMLIEVGDEEFVIRRGNTLLDQSVNL